MTTTVHDPNDERSYFTNGWTLEKIGASSPRPVNSTEENVISTASSHSPIHSGGNTYGN